MFEQMTDIFTLLMNLIGLMMCLFLYFRHTRRTITLAVVFFLANLLSEYYWVVYSLVMGDSPSVSSFFAYFGWNLAFVIPVLIQLSLRRERGRHSLSPLAFIPVILTVPQFMLYIQFGGIFNNIWQCFWTTVIACLAVDAIVSYLRSRDEDKVFPYLNTVLFFFVAFEYTEWTASCYDWPSDFLNPYYYFSILTAICYILIPAALSREFRYSDTRGNKDAKERLMTATYDYYKLAHPEQGVSSGFIYKTVPHITLKSIANNEPPAEETLYDQPEIDKTKVRVSGPFTVESLPAPVVKPLDELAMKVLQLTRFGR